MKALTCQPCSTAWLMARTPSIRNSRRCVRLLRLRCSACSVCSTSLFDRTWMTRRSCIGTRCADQWASPRMGRVRCFGRTDLAGLLWLGCFGWAALAGLMRLVLTVGLMAAAARAINRVRWPRNGALTSDRKGCCLGLAHIASWRSLAKNPAFRKRLSSGRSMCRLWRVATPVAR